MAFRHTSSSSESEEAEYQAMPSISETMQITVTTCYGSSIVSKVLNVTTATLVGTVKNLIEPSIEQSRKSMSYEGRMLEDDKTLSFYGVKSNSDLLMVITPTAAEEAELPKLWSKSSTRLRLMV